MRKAQEVVLRLGSHIHSPNIDVEYQRRLYKIRLKIGNGLV